MKTFEPYYLAYEDGVITTIFHADDRLSKDELIDEFKKHELPFSCLRVNVGYFSLEDQFNHKLSCKCYYNCQGYEISTMSFPREYLDLPFYQQSLRRSNHILVKDALNKQNDTVTVVVVIDPDWQPLTSYDIYVLTQPQYSIWFN